MHVGYFIDGYFPIIDGVDKVTDAYASRLVKKCDVTVFTPHVFRVEPGYDDRFDYEVIRSKSIMREHDAYPQGVPFFDRKFMARVRAAKLDIIHIHSVFTMGLYAKAFARKKDIPMVGTIHSDFRPDVRSYLGKGLGEAIIKLMMSGYNACDECWTVNDAVGRKFQREYGLKRPYRVMPYSTDHVPVRDIAAARAEINAAFGLKDDDFVLAHVGRQDLQKREDFILRTLAVLKKDLKDFKMLFIGDGNQQAYLKSLTEKLGLSNQVIFCGIISDQQQLMKAYSRIDLLLFASDSDTYGLVKIEAACQKTPTLFCEGTMVADGITNGINGFTAANSEEANAAAILRLHQDRRLLETVGEGAFRDLYRTWDNVADNVYEQYLRIIENHKFAKK